VWHGLICELTYRIDRPSMSQAKTSGPAKLRRISFQNRERPQITSTPSANDTTSVFEQLVTALADLVQDDSRFTISAFRPSRPPNALQVMLLKFAQYLVSKYGDELPTLTRIGLAMIPAFYSFPTSMHQQLLVFFSRDLLIRVADAIKRERPFADNDRATGPSMSHTPAEV
jgi:hypothetical protein